MELRFLQPGWAWFFPAMLVALAVLRRLRRRPYLATTTAERLGGRAARPSRLRRLPVLLLAGALGLVTVALMEPVVPYSEREVESWGLDIVLVLDLSSSMQEVMDARRPSRDMASLFTARDRPLTLQPAGPTRLETTKEALRALVSRRRGDRIGLVVFSDNAYVVSPLTFDYDSLLHYIEMVDDRILRGEGMTAIGEGIAVANHLLFRQRGAERRSQVIVVFTDGEHNFGREPLGSLEQSDAAGIRVHLVGVDLEEEIKGKEAVRWLVAAVKAQGGKYFEADTERALFAASAEIDSLEKGLVRSKAYVRHAPAYQTFALGAAALVLAAVALRAIPFFADLT
jgi:Ca-activated chloride channel family protein